MKQSLVDIGSQQHNISITFTKINELVPGLKCNSYRNG